MMRTLLHRIRFNNARELALAILAWDNNCYIGGEDGGAFAELILVEETLSDGSKVKDFRLR